MPNSTPPSRASIDNNTRFTRSTSGMKLASTLDPEPNGNTHTPPTPIITTTRPLARERPFAREDVNTSRPPSIRSATSFGGRPNINRFIPGHHARHHSSYSNFSTMSETALPWTTRDIGFNAISGVLNDPAKRAQDISRPSKSDIPPVHHAHIPRIKPNDFDAYLKHVGPAFERYHQNKKESEETVIVPEEEIEVSPQEEKRGRNPYSLPHHVLSSESLLEEEAKTPPRDLPMLENVPTIFFQPDFYLENPQVFDTVCEGADIVGYSGPNPPVSTNAILQEKLSYYLDTVEVHLLREIENRSSSFFEALSNLQALHQQTLDCVSQIHTIRKKMKQIQETECKDGLQVVRIQVRKRSLEKLYRVTAMMKEIQAAQPMIQILTTQGDYFAALDLIQVTRNTLQSQDQDVDLTKLKALSHIPGQLDDMQKSVGVMMQHDYLGILLSDLSYKMESIDATRAKQELLKLAESNEENKDQWEENVDLEKEKDLLERMRPSAIGLLRTNMLMTTLNDYRTRFMVEIKDIVRKRYPSTTATTTEDQSHQLARQLKTMPFSAFFQMLLDIFSTMIEAIRRASVYHQLLLHIMESSALDPAWMTELSKESADIVFSAADLAHVRCGKLMSFRSDQNALLNPTDFYRLSSVIRTFILQCEVFCGRTCFGLRGTVVSQQKAFVDHFHMERVKQEAQLIENEQWTASEVPSDFQLIVDRICEGRIASFLEGNVLQQQQQQHDEEKSTKHLIIDGQSYYVVGCSLLILKMFEDYLKCVLNLDSMTAEIMQKLLELLKLFNSRVCQVILGAGAMRSAGLKNITAKHLALASQSLAVMIALVPKLKACIGHQLPTKQTNSLAEFDKIAQDFINHQGEIHAKLVAIMNERFTAHVKAMQMTRWDEEEPQTGKNANVYMETLVTETVRLHKVLAKYLPVHDLKLVMSQVFESFTLQLSQEISQTSIKTERGKSRLARDAAYFTRRLKSLHHIDPPSNSVMEAVDAIHTSATSSPTP